MWTKCWSRYVYCNFFRLFFPHTYKHHAHDCTQVCRKWIYNCIVQLMVCMLYFIYHYVFFYRRNWRPHLHIIKSKYDNLNFELAPLGMCAFACVHIWIRMYIIVNNNLVRVCGISWKTDGAVCFFLFVLQYIYSTYLNWFRFEAFYFQNALSIHR